MTNKAFELQKELKVNAEEYQGYLKELYRWEDEIKVKDENLKQSTCKQEPRYPIRGKEGCSLEPSNTAPSAQTMNESTVLTEAQRQQKAVIEKEKGNQFFKELKYDKAITSYSLAIELNPRDPILYANRAMALLKINKFKESEEDCTKSIELDPSYVKAYHRRGVAKLSLGRKDQAVKDFEEVLRWEPHNKAAVQELERLKRPTSPISSEKQLNEEKTSQDTSQRKAKIVEIFDKPEEGSSVILSLEHPALTTVERFPDLSYTPKTTEPQQLLKILKVNDSQHEKRIIDKVVKLVDEKHQITEAPSQLTIEMKSTSKVPPPVPKNYAQFNQDWNKLAGNNELLFSYLKKITPSKLPEIFRESLEPDVLGNIIRLLEEEFPTRNEPVFPWLHGLSNVKRIRAVVLFLPANLKTNLRDLIKSVSSSEGVSDEDRQRVLQTLGM